MPAAAATTSALTPERMSPFVSACNTTTAARPATKARWSASAAVRLTRPVRSSAARSAAGSANVTASAKSTISVGEDPRTAKKAAFFPRMSSSGCASAKAERASRWAPRVSARRTSLSDGGADKVEDALSRRELLGAEDVEPLAEAALEPVAPVVGVVAGPLPPEEPPDHRVLGSRELDDERGVEAAQPVEELGDRDVAADREVMDERQAEREVGRAARRERPPLEPAPAEARRGVGEVHRQREDLRLALVPERLVEPVDDERIGVDRDHLLGGLGGDPRVAALVAAEVPDEPGPLGRHRCGDERGLPLRVLVAVGRRRPVARPRRAGRPPLQARDEPLEALDVRDDQLLPEPRLLQLALDVDVAILVAALEARMEEDVRERAATEAVAQREQVPALLRRDPVDPSAEPRLEGHVLPGLEEERVEEEHAELPVAGPGLALTEPLERADVDEDRLRAAELDVVGRGVLEDQAGADRAPHEVELEQRRVAEHPEGPLVGVGDDGDDVVLEDGRNVAVEGVRHFRDAVRLVRADELPLALQLREE